MSYGLRVWDASGNLKLEVSDRLAKFLGAVVLPAGYTGFVACPNISSVTTWVAYAYASGDTNMGGSVYDRFSHPSVPDATGVYVAAPITTDAPRTITIYFWGY